VDIFSKESGCRVGEALKYQDILEARLQTPVPTNKACPALAGNWILRPDRLDERPECKENIQ